MTDEPKLCWFPVYDWRLGTTEWRSAPASEEADLKSRGCVGISHKNPSDAILEQTRVLNGAIEKIIKENPERAHVASEN